MLKKIVNLIAMGTLLATAPSLHAAPANYWVNWTGAPAGYTQPLPSKPGKFYATGATGTLFDPNTNTTINVTYSGEVYETSEFNLTSGSIDIFNHPGAYSGPSILTLPPSGNFVALTGFSGLTNTLTFSAPVTNLVLAIASLGAAPPNPDGQYIFDRPFVLMSEGLGEFSPFAGCENTCSDLWTTGTSLFGREGNGVIQFPGTFTTLSWTVGSPELWSAFNVGITSGTVPEPTSVSLVLAACLAIAASRRRRRS